MNDPRRRIRSDDPHALGLIALGSRRDLELDVLPSSSDL